jgi:serine protease Do
MRLRLPSAPPWRLQGTAVRALEFLRVMKRRVALYLVLVAVLASFGVGHSQDGNEGLRRLLGDTELAGQWIYDDLDAAVKQASKTGQPLMVLLRCVP